MTETQSSIEAWRAATFGTVSPSLIAARMNVEVAELLLELARPNPSVKKIEGECADVLIVLYGICEAYGIELHNAVDRKMSVNRSRTWDVRDGVGQHVASVSHRFEDEDGLDYCKRCGFWKGAAPEACSPRHHVKEQP